MLDKLAGVDPIKREPLASEIARKLVDYLLSGGIEPGDRVPSERQLAEAFGVGRSAMREALKSLTFLGLLEVRHGDGTYLKKADSVLLPRVVEWGLLLGEKRTVDLVEARQKLEAVIAGMAAVRRDEADLVELRRLLGRMERLEGDPPGFVDADVAFHLRLAEAAGNTALRDILTGIQALLRAWIGRAISAEGDIPISYREHVPILAAVERGDELGAIAAMEAHLAAAAVRLQRALEAQGRARGRAQGRGEVHDRDHGRADGVIRPNAASEDGAATDAAGAPERGRR